MVRSEQNLRGVDPIPAPVGQPDVRLRLRPVPAQLACPAQQGPGWERRREGTTGWLLERFG